METALALLGCSLQIFGPGHRNDVVAGIDVVNFAGDGARQLGQQIQRRPAEFVERHASAERRVLLLESKHRARIANARTRKSTYRTGRDRVHADAARAEGGSEIA